jgi:hypothetical protein
LVDDHDVVTVGQSLRVLADRAGVTLIGYRELRELQRQTASSLHRDAEQ